MSVVSKGGGGGSGDGDVNAPASADSNGLAVFSGTGGKTLKQASGSGLVKLASGVVGTGTAGTDYAPALGYAPVDKAGNLSGAGATQRAALGLHHRPMKVFHASESIANQAAGIHFSGKYYWPSSNSIRTWDGSVQANIALGSSIGKLIYVPESGLLFALDNSGGANAFWTSPDGANWTPHNIGTTGIICSSIAWSGSIFVLTNSVNGTIYTSPDAVTWTTHVSAVDAAVIDVAYAASLGLFVITGFTGSTATGVAYSSDGASWTTTTLAGTSAIGVQVCWSPDLNLFLLSTLTGTNKLWSSPDGVTWTARSTAAFGSLAWSGAIQSFVCTQSASAAASCYLSPDGANLYPLDTGKQCWAAADGPKLVLGGNGYTLEVE